MQLLQLTTIGYYFLQVLISTQMHDRIKTQDGTIHEQYTDLFNIHVQASSMDGQMLSDS